MEIIICSAMRFKDKIWRGHRHGDAMSAMHSELSYTMNRKQMIKQRVNEEQGFITSKNRYVDRIEGAKIAYKAKQIKEKKELLYSEDLY